MPKVIALAGNPNCGKTTLFNNLTGSSQYVGNWPGVTVEKKEGKVRYHGYDMTVVDLPGIYSLSPYTLEEVVSRDFIEKEHPDVVLNIIDGTNIERNLYLTLQLIELGIPVIVAVNMMDDVIAKGDRIDTEAIAKELGVPVIPISAKKGDNIKPLLKAVENSTKTKYTYTRVFRYDDNTEIYLKKIKELLIEYAEFDHIHIDYYAAKLLEADDKIAKNLNLSDHLLSKIDEILSEYESSSLYGDRETMLADARYKFIEKLTKKNVKKNIKHGELTVSDKIDKVVTHKYFAIPVFLLIMLLMFTVTFSTIGDFLKTLVESGVESLSTVVSGALETAAAPAWTQGLIVDAIIGGVGGILTFLPQIMLLFFFLSLLEDSGYMARAAFIMDRLLRKLGLSGKAFIPMLMGFGCTTPAVMAARTMENEKDRRLTILLTPFMSCGAKLPIYGLFAGIFFQKHQGFVVFSLYILGMAIAILAGIILKNTLFKGDNSTFVMELPPYRLPGVKSMLLHMWEKCKGFLIKAGTIIFSMSVLIWLLQNFSITFQMVENPADSIIGMIGAFIAPIFIPLGFGTWQASVSLITGLVAKEAVVTTMTVLYESTGTTINAAVATAFTPVTAYAFMVFTLLYIPCISAFVTIRKELNSAKWTAFSAALQMGIAYVAALLVNVIGNLIF